MPEAENPEPAPQPEPAPEPAGSISPGLDRAQSEQPEGRRGSGVFNANPLLSVTSAEPDTSGDEELARRLELAQQIELAGGGRVQEDGAEGAAEEPADGVQSDEVLAGVVVVEALNPLAAATGEPS